MQRPSNKELFNKIRTGKEIVAKGNIYPINIDSIAADAIELGYQVTNLQNILISLLDEVQIDNYVGGHPPKKSYESLIKDSDLFEFKWESKRLGCDIYLKYCLKDEFFFNIFTRAQIAEMKKKGGGHDDGDHQLPKWTWRNGCSGGHARQNV